MNFRKVIMVVLSAAVLSASTVTAFAANPQEAHTINDAKQISASLSPRGETNAKKQVYFNSITGTVKSITDSETSKDIKYVLVENENGEEANIVISKDTYILNNAEVTVGKVVTGFYASNTPMLMIYPPQYKTEVLVVGNMDQIVKYDVFDKDLISSDKSLKLSISDKTEIVSQDGKAFEGELANRKLVVLYGVSSKSIPAQTNPSKIIVLFDKPATPIISPTEQEASAPTSDISVVIIGSDKKEIRIPLFSILRKIQLWLQTDQQLNP